MTRLLFAPKSNNADVIGDFQDLYGDLNQQEVF